VELFTRRHVLLGVSCALGALAGVRDVLAQTPPATAGPVDPKLIEDLVAANRILADQGVVDGYGHVSVRHEKSPDRYLMSRSIAPELVTAADIMEYDLDSTAVDARGRTSYLERFIHGEIYRVRPDVRAIVHNHSPSVIPFGATAAPLRPLYHMSAFLSGGVPVFDIRQAGGMTDMLVRTAALGQALARTLRSRGGGRGREPAPRGLPQRVHGGQRAPAVSGHGDWQRSGHLPRSRGGAPGGSVRVRDRDPALGALEEEGARPLSRAPRGNSQRRRLL